jgi:ABC-type lipoprotein export system ATPase subunit
VGGREQEERELTGQSAIDPQATAGPGEPVLVGRNLVKVYGDGAAATTALDGVDVELVRGRTLAVVGPSGSGKSTLLHLLAGIDVPTQGTVEVDGRRLDKMNDTQSAEFRATKVGFVLQRDNLIPSLTIRENVAAPQLLSGAKRADAIRRADELLERVGMAARADAFPNAVSGGEAQRAVVARACTGRPLLVFADEPTGALDQASGDGVMELLRELVSDVEAASVIVTHDPRVAQHAHETLRLVDGHVVDADR